MSQAKDNKNANIDDTPSAVPEMARSENDIPAEVLEKMNDVIGDIEETPGDEEKEQEDIDKDSEKEESEEQEELEEKEQDVEGREKSEGGDAEDSEEIDSRLVAAARDLGWSDDEIVQTAETNIKILEDLADLMDMVDVGKSQPIQTPVVEKEKQDEIGKIELNKEELTKLKEDFGEGATSVIKNLAGKLNTAIDTVNTLKGSVDNLSGADAQQQELINMQIANEVFDEASKEFPTLSTTDKLPRTPDGNFISTNRAFRQRSKIFDVAHAFASSGMNFKEAMREAMKWYKGENVKEVVEDKVVKDLNKRKRKFSPKPTRKHSKRTFKDKDSEAEHFMGELYDKLGN